MKALLAVLLLSPALAFADGDAQVALLSRLHQEASTRAELGDLVHVKGREAAAFAATVANDWRVIDQAVLEYARDNRVALTPVPADPQAEPLRKLSGATLDHRFLAYVSLSSQALADQLTAERGQGDASYKRVINRALSTARQHRREADRLLREIPAT